MSAELPPFSLCGISERFLSQLEVRGGSQKPLQPKSRVAPVRTAQEHGNTGAHTTTDVILQLTANSSPNTLRRKLCRTGCVRCAQAGQSLLTGLLPPPTPGRPSPLITAPNIIQTWMSRRVQTHPLSIQRRYPFLDKPTSLRSKRRMTSRDGNVAASTAVYRPCCIVRDPDCRCLEAQCYHVCVLMHDNSRSNADCCGP